MKTWLRQHRYALTTTLRRYALQPFSTLTNILVIALILTVPLVGTAMLSSLQPVARDLSTEPQVSLFLDPALSPTAAQAVYQRLQAQADDENYTLHWISREQALQALQDHPSWQGALQALPENPLPDSVIVTLAGDDVASQAERLAQQWQSWEGVDLVQLDSTWLQRLQALLQFAQLALVLLGIGVAVVVLATVFNTVRMQALAQREEITVARLVGATEAFVRRPFLYQGALTAGLAGVVALLASKLSLGLLNRPLGQLMQSYGSDFTLKLPSATSLATFLILVALLGAFSARWSVTRNTRF